MKTDVKMAKKVNLLQLVNGFGVGGGELKLLELCARLNRDKFDITIASVGQGGPLEQHFRALGLPTYVIPKSMRFDFTLPFKVAALMRQTQTEIIMSTLFFADIIGALSTLFYKPKALVSWEVITGQLKRHQIWMYKCVASRFDQVVAVSNSIHPFIIKDRGQKADKIKTIYYGVDLEKYQVRDRLRQNNGIVFGTVARLVHQKGHTYLLDAIPSVLEKYPNTRWCFAGGGDLDASLKQKAQALGIAHAVEFMGVHNDVAHLLQNFDIFILPSLWEGFPNVLLEAMASGKPVIATAVEGTIELVIDRDTGYLVPKQDSQALAKAMLQFLAHPQLIDEFGKKGRKRVEQLFSLEMQISEFEKLYDGLL